MRWLAWLGVAVGSVAALAGLLGPGRLRRAPRGPALRVLLFGLGGFVTVVCLLGALDDGLAATLATAPGAELRFPGGRLLDTTRVGSVGHAGAAIERVYVVDDSDAAIVAWFDAELGRLGYTLAPQQAPSAQDRRDLRVLRRYGNGGFAYEVRIGPLPVRAGGVTVPAGRGSALWTTVMTAP